MLYITLRQYEYLVGVADTKSLTRAAQKLHVSQPSLSVAITRVERRLGQPIFLRGKGAAIEITPFGHRVLAKAREVLELAAGIEKEDASATPFVLGCFEDIAPWYLAPALDRLKSRFPDLRIEGREGRFSDIADALTTGRMDVAISYEVGFAGKFRRRRLRQVSPVAFLSTDHPLATETRLELTDLIDRSVILFREGQSEGFMNELFERMQIAPDICSRVASLEVMRSMAAHRTGIGVSYTYPPGDMSYDGKPLVTLPIVTPEAKADISLIWSEHRQECEGFAALLDCLSGLP